MVDVCIRHMDRAIVFAGSEFTLHNYVSAFCEARRRVREAVPEPTTMLWTPENFCRDKRSLGLEPPMGTQHLL